MAASGLEHFVAAIYESGILPAAEVQAFFDSIGEHECPNIAEDLAEEMIRRGMLTPFQARALLNGKTRGLVLGSYVVLDQLGKGGMGRLFRCMHRQMKRVVVLKVLPPSSMKSQQSVERFQREVEAMARLSHPNIVTAFDAGEDKGLRFLAMEYVDGSDLKSLVADRGPLPVATAVNYVIQAAQGLEYAHWHGMIHRDVKPENLILDWRGVVKVLDLGIVKLVAGLAEPGNGEVRVSAERPLTYGTPDYMAPEQLTHSDSISPACDVYSLGCTLHYLLLGRPVFSGNTVEAKVMAHLSQPVPSLQAARSDVPDPLDRFFRLMLAKRPEDRPATMGDVIAELQKCQAMLPLSERDPTPISSILDDQSRPDVHDAATLPVRLLDRCPSAHSEQSSERFGTTRRIVIGLGVVGVFSLGFGLGILERPSGQGSLVVEIHGPHATVQVIDADGEIVADCPSAAGRLEFCLPTGSYRVIVRGHGGADLSEDVNLFDRHIVVITVPNNGS